MIIRITRGLVRQDAEGEVVARLRGATEERGRPDGLHALFIGRHMAPAGMELIVITVWRDASAIAEALGDGWESAKWLAGVDEHMSDSTVEHWETAVEELDPGMVLSSMTAVGARAVP